MSVLPQLERELLAAHRRLGERRHRRRLPLIGDGVVARWLSRTVAAVPLVLAVLVTLTVALVALFMVHHGSPPGPQGPPSGGPPMSPPPPLLPAHPSRKQRHEIGYLDRAWGTVIRDDRSCTPRPLPQERPTISGGSPSPALLSILGVLRRPAQPTDRLPTRITYHPYTVDPQGSLPPAKNIYLHYIRRARWRFGAGYYLVPAGNINPGRSVPAHCYVEQRAALERELAHVPGQLRSATLALEPRYLAWARYDASPYPGVSLVALNSTGNGDGGSGATLDDIESGHTIVSGGPTGVGVVYGIVPDGVATVTLYYHGRYPGHPVTVRNIANVFIAPNPRQRFPDNGFPYRAVWRSANGSVVKTITY